MARTSHRSELINMTSRQKSSEYSGPVRAPAVGRSGKQAERIPRPPMDHPVVAYLFIALCALLLVGAIGWKIETQARDIREAERKREAPAPHGAASPPPVPPAPGTVVTTTGAVIDLAPSTPALPSATRADPAVAPPPPPRAVPAPPRRRPLPARHRPDEAARSAPSREAYDPLDDNPYDSPVPSAAASASSQPAPERLFEIRK